MAWGSVITQEILSDTGKFSIFSCFLTQGGWNRNHCVKFQRQKFSWYWENYNNVLKMKVSYPEMKNVTKNLLACLCSERSVIWLRMISIHSDFIYVCFFNFGTGSWVCIKTRKKKNPTHTLSVLDGFSYLEAFCTYLILCCLMCKYCHKCLEIAFFRTANLRSLRPWRLELKSIRIAMLVKINSC